jgi:hypothetical protein
MYPGIPSLMTIVALLFHIFLITQTQKYTSLSVNFHGIKSSITMFLLFVYHLERSSDSRVIPVRNIPLKEIKKIVEHTNLRRKKKEVSISIFG